MNGVIYARYSSERQTEQSIEGQLRDCGEFAKQNNIKIVATYIEETNVPSLLLFQKLGFSKIGKEDELITLRKLLRR